MHVWVGPECNVAHVAGLRGTETTGEIEDGGIRVVLEPVEASCTACNLVGFGVDLLAG